MISRPTVVVVGAGASFELGLPLSTDLKEQIASALDITFPDGFRQTTGDFDVTNYLRELASDSGHQNINGLLAKCWLIRDALPASISIDNLLDAHRNDPDIVKLGKVALAKSILNAERASKLYTDPSSGRAFPLTQAAGTWLLPMFQLLTEGVTKENADKIFENITFIVFNYDRCLEKYLPVALSHYYGLDDAQTAKIVAKANIIHPYGRVGELGEGRSLTTVPFGSQQFTLKKVAEGIRTFTEGLRHDSYRQKIGISVANAEQIIFLGFAFHPMNMEILKVGYPSAVRKVFGTTKGLSDAAVRSVESAIYDTLMKLPPSNEIGEYSNLEVTEMNLEPKTASDFLFSHFRGIS